LQYHKINGVYKRYTKMDKEEGKIPEGKVWGEFIDGEYSCPEYKVLEDAPWEWTEKIDGINSRIYVDPIEGTLELRGKTDNAMIPKALQNWFDTWVEEWGNIVFSTLSSPCILYGEGVGPKIQKGKHPFTEYEVILFDILIDKWWLKIVDVDSISDTIGLRSVPFMGVYSLKEALELMKNKEVTSFFGDKPMEGIIGTPKGGLLDRGGRRIITKLKFRDFK
jgi:hypothetical protein